MNVLSRSKPRWKAEPPKALVVDDVEQNGKVLIRLLALWGIPCDSVSSGEAAMEYLRLSRVDIVFLDIMMPKMSGVEVLTHIRESYGHASPKCVAYSAHVLEHERASYHASSFDGILPKPIEMEELVQLIHTHFEHLMQTESEPERTSGAALDLSALHEPAMAELRRAVERYAVTEIMRQIDHIESEGMLDPSNCQILKKLVRAGDMKRILVALDTEM